VLIAAGQRDAVICAILAKGGWFGRCFAEDAYFVGDLALRRFLPSEL
jgi:hypothetical protein